MSSKPPNLSRRKSSRGPAASGTQPTVRTDMRSDHQSGWTDTIDDWEAVLTESAASTDRSESEAETTAVAPGIDRIDPMSEPLFEAIVAVLPDAWRTDTDAQRLIQWVVYTFVDETNAKLSTSIRAKTAIDQVADRTGINPVMLRRICTTSLYRDRSGSAKRHFYADLQAIESRTAS